MSTVAQRVREHFQRLGPPLDVIDVREIGWRKLESGQTTFVLAYKTVQTDEPLTIEVAPECPKCGDSMVRRSGKFGEFWGCGSYPGCKGTARI